MKQAEKADEFREDLLGSTVDPDDTHSEVLPYETKEDLREAVENFRTYLMILNEWDQKDRAKRRTHRPPSWLIDQEPADKI